MAQNISFTKVAALALYLFLSLPLTAQPPAKPAPEFYRNVIVLDPAHGGPDTGAALDSGLLEKDVVLAFAARLKAALAAAGFTVVTTRDGDPDDALSADQRAEIANHARPLACLLLHATDSGAGVHIVTSELSPAGGGRADAPQLWRTAQARRVSESLALARELGAALRGAKLPALQMRAPVPPIDSLISAAAAIEIAPSSRRVPVEDAAYQQRIAAGIVKALSAFRAERSPEAAGADE